MDQARRLLLSIFLGLLVVDWIADQAPVKAEQDILELEEQAMKAAVVRIAPSVIRIETFGGLEKVGRLLVGTGPTTGLVVSKDGFAISSAFNFVQKPSSILVTLSNGDRASAKIVARDHSRMLVLLKVNTDQPLDVPEFVPRGQMMVGQWSIAVGRTFSLDEPNMSIGILSATNRVWGKAIQTDAAVSPSNYGGPLIDIHGRVLGVLVPLSPQGRDEEIAGAEWYDSGIGFAVPLEDVNTNLSRMREGEDLYAGLLGISLKAGDLYADEVIVAAVPAKSPAAKAGIKAGDKIVEVNGIEIIRQSQLKHVLGVQYAGDTVTIAVLRDDKRIERRIELTDKLIPYEHPFLGVLPQRSSESEAGVTVRFVYAESPAEQAELGPGDRITRLGQQEIADAGDLREAIANLEPNDTVRMTYSHDEVPKEVEVRLANLPIDIPDPLPAAADKPDAPLEEHPNVGVVPIRIPEAKNECIAYVPEDYHPQASYGLVVWLHAPDGFDQDRLVERWQDHCRERGLILLAPQSADPKRWVSTETEFIRKTMDDVISSYRIDPTRVVVHGYQAGGALAYLVGLANRELVRGIAAVDAALPRRLPVPANDPIERLAVYTTTADNTRLAEATKEGVERLREQKYPVTEKSHGTQPRYLNSAEIEELVRWIDSLDRI